MLRIHKLTSMRSGKALFARHFIDELPSLIRRTSFLYIKFHNASMAKYGRRPMISTILASNAMFPKNLKPIQLRRRGPPSCWSHFLDGALDSKKYLGNNCLYEGKQTTYNVMEQDHFWGHCGWANQVEDIFKKTVLGRSWARGISWTLLDIRTTSSWAEHRARTFLGENIKRRKAKWALKKTRLYRTLYVSFYSRIAKFLVASMFHVSTFGLYSLSSAHRNRILAELLEKRYQEYTILF